MRKRGTDSFIILSIRAFSGPSAWRCGHTVPRFITLLKVLCGAGRTGENKNEKNVFIFAVACGGNNDEFTIPFAGGHEQ